MTSSNWIAFEADRSETGDHQFKRVFTVGDRLWSICNPASDKSSLYSTEDPWLGEVQQDECGRLTLVEINKRPCYPQKKISIRESSQDLYDTFGEAIEAWKTAATNELNEDIAGHEEDIRRLKGQIEDMPHNKAKLIAMHCGIGKHVREFQELLKKHGIDTYKGEQCKGLCWPISLTLTRFLRAKGHVAFIYESPGHAIAAVVTEIETIGIDLAGRQFDSRNPVPTYLDQEKLEREYRLAILDDGLLCDFKETDLDCIPNSSNHQ